MNSLKRLKPFLKPYNRWSLLSILFLLGVVMTDLSIPRLVQRIIDQGIANQNINLILWTMLLMIGIAVVNAGLSIGNTILAVYISQNIGADLRKAIVRKIQTFSFGNLDRFQTGQLLIRPTSDVNQVQIVVMGVLRILFRWPLTMLGSVIMLFLINRELALIVLILIPVFGVLIWQVASRFQSLFLIVRKKLDRLNTVLQENLAGIRVVKAFVRAEYENARFEKANDDLKRQTIAVMRVLAIFSPTVRAIANLGVVVVIWIGGKQIIAGDGTLGQLVASINYLISSMIPLLLVGRIIGPAADAAASIHRIFEVLDERPDVQDRPAVQPVSPITGRVTFENVTFHYDHNNNEPVLKDINLQAEPGQIVAILGAIGSGKTSLMHLIPRFYDVTAGTITLDGIDIHDIPLETIRNQVGIAFQEAILFRGTIRDNIRYGRPEATEEEIITAATIAQAHDFIAALPDGYDTLVGPRGVTLSGGQKQRISIARALLIRPRVLILDDSTSAVDVETGIKIHAGLNELVRSEAQPITAFIITQRISTVLNADKIIVLNQGEIVGTGTHTDLLQSCQIYQEIYASQLGDGGKNHDQ